MNHSATSLAAGRRWRPWEFVLLAVLLASWFVLPGQALLLNEIAILVAVFEVEQSTDCVSRASSYIYRP